MCLWVGNDNGMYAPPNPTLLIHRSLTCRCLPPGMRCEALKDEYAWWWLTDTQAAKTRGQGAVGRPSSRGGRTSMAWGEGVEEWRSGGVERWRSGEVESGEVSGWVDWVGRSTVTSTKGLG